MRHPWEPEIDLSPDRVRALVEGQFPELAPARVEPIGAGWDNLACLVNGEWVFRFPRRAEGRPLMENELRWLGSVGPSLPLPVPSPRWFGRPEGDYPYPFGGYRHLPGTTADRVDPGPEHRTAAAEPLGRFLAALHGIPVDADTEREGPRDLYARTDLALREARAMERLDGLAGLPSDAIRTEMESLAATPPWAGGPRWVHADFSARHLLLDDARRPCGVLDWGDMHLGDPAVDLSVAWTFLPPAARDRFWSAYGPADAATRARARFYALFFGVVLVHFGRTAGDPVAERVGRIALDLALV